MINDQSFILIAHRGFPCAQEENSKISFEEAIANGAKCIEFDIQLTQDGVPVVFHDECLTRLCHDTRLVSECLYQSLPSTISGHHILALADLLDILKNQQCSLHMEIKNPKSIEAALSLVVDHDMQQRVMISSFCHDVIEISKILHPCIKTMALFEQQTGRTQVRHVIAKTKCDAIGMDYDSWSIHKHLFPIPTYLFTLNNLDQIRIAEQHGISGAYTDNIQISHLSPKEIHGH